MTTSSGGTFVLIGLLAGALLCCSRATAQCADMTDVPVGYDPSEEHRALIAKKIDYALAVVSDEQLLQRDPSCVAKALFFLGRFHVEKAIPRMIALLTFEYKQENPITPPLIAQRYPAIAGLGGIGKPAVPVLLNVIKDSQTDLEKENAMHALTIVYVEHPKQLLDLLQTTADSEPDNAKASHLREARARVQSLECHDTNRCEVDPD